jgi:hypothetical protein
MGVAHSQPSTSGAVATLQSDRPVLHVYEHVVPLHLAEPVAVLHALLHPPQLDVDVSEVSHPLVSGAVVVQLAQPFTQPPYVHEPLEEQLAPVLVFVSQARPQAPQFDAVVIDVSHPLTSGGVVLQLA